MISFRAIYKMLFRLVVHPSKWRFNSIGLCDSCGMRSIFLFSKSLFVDLNKLTSTWTLSPEFKISLTDRENYYCCNCNANFRQRTLAKTSLALLGVKSFKELNTNKLSVYETAAYDVFRGPIAKACRTYHVSEYFAEMPTGSFVSGVRNENLEKLTFADNSFDLLITSDVLEHVANIDAAISEMKRVLKPGGVHIFSVPVDVNLEKTIERSIVESGVVKHILPKVFHGDTIRSEGILTFRDFGADTISYMSRFGFQAVEQQYLSPQGHICYLYFSRKET